MLLKPYQAIWPGRMEYPVAARWQEQLAFARQADHIPDTVAFLEYSPSYVYGRAARRSCVRLTDQQLQELGLQVWEADHGGGPQYYGPGQLAGCLILDLAAHGGDLVRLARRVAEALAETVRSFGLTGAAAREGAGVWVGEERVAAVTTKAAGGVTSHGFVLDLDTDLAGYEPILPATGPVATLAGLIGREVPRRVAAGRFLRQFEETLGYQVNDTHPVQLEEQMRFEEGT